MAAEYIVYCDEQGVPTGEIAPKLAGHTADTRMHLAFSCYVFNGEGKILVTQRAAHKKVWPTVWTNSVCGHIAPNESMQAAIERRAQYELGMTVQGLACVLPSYRYKTPPYRGIIEHEFCPVYFARSDDTVRPNPDEVAAYEWVTWEAYCMALNQDSADTWSWWAKDQLAHIDQADARQRIAALIA